MLFELATHSILNEMRITGKGIAADSATKSMGYVRKISQKVGSYDKTKKGRFAVMPELPRSRPARVKGGKEGIIVTEKERTSPFAVEGTAGNLLGFCNIASLFGLSSTHFGGELEKAPWMEDPPENLNATIGSNDEIIVHAKVQGSDANRIPSECFSKYGERYKSRRK